ncbi:ANTAR domain-containing response regulator [Paenibacillus turpanensis]|uniref:ANTAR domain-containing response regulator n=1 Tax=Paenibacillus turpanensis TaxID=2689078 RepID=UPI0014093A9D|nr:ANTAR domain-containing protein [Paenibacillus turpanensis]
MLQHLLIIRHAPTVPPLYPQENEPKHTMDNLGPTKERMILPKGAETKPISPEQLLTEAGLRFKHATDVTSCEDQIRHCDAVLLCVPTEKLDPWISSLMKLKELPILWWCEELNVAHSCKIHTDIDGMLVPSMTVPQLHYSLLVASQHYLARTQWKKEREQLLARLEERKWIDRAKGILCEIKKINEVEAYEFLRKQAMNDRKRLVDVAVSIVKVYDLLREQDGGDRSK